MSTCEFEGDKEGLEQQKAQYSVRRPAMGGAGTLSFWERISSPGGQPCHAWEHCWPLGGSEDVGVVVAVSQE